MEDVPAGCVYAGVVGIKAEASEGEEGTSRLVLRDERYQKYISFIESFCTFEKRVEILNKSEFGEKKDHRFIDIVWCFKDEEEQEHLGFIMKNIKCLVC